MDWSELLNWDEYLKLFIGLLAVTDPLGSLPTVLGLTENYADDEKKLIARLSVITFVVTLLLFAFVGGAILNLFGITTAALRIAGGIMFLFYALEMMDLIRLPAASQSAKTAGAASIAIVPIGIPLLAGPGTMSTVIIFAEAHYSFTHQFLVVTAILAVGILVFALYRISLVMGQKLGETSMTILNRIMGLMLAAIAVEFILDGIAAHFPGLGSIH